MARAQVWSLESQWQVHSPAVEAPGASSLSPASSSANLSSQSHQAELLSRCSLVEGGRS